MIELISSKRLHAVFVPIYLENVDVPQCRHDAQYLMPFNEYQNHLFCVTRTILKWPLEAVRFFGTHRFVRSFIPGPISLHMPFIYPFSVTDYNKCLYIFFCSSFIRNKQQQKNKKKDDPICCFQFINNRCNLLTFAYCTHSRISSSLRYFVSK